MVRRTLNFFSMQEKKTFQKWQEEGTQTSYWDFYANQAINKTSEWKRIRRSKPAPCFHYQFGSWWLNCSARMVNAHLLRIILQDESQTVGKSPLALLYPDIKNPLNTHLHNCYIAEVSHGERTEGSKKPHFIEWDTHFRTTIWENRKFEGLFTKWQTCLENGQCLCGIKCHGRFGSRDISGE